MATTSPPQPPPLHEPPPPGGGGSAGGGFAGGGPVVRGPGFGRLPRVLAVGGIAVVVLVLAYLIFAGGGGGDYHLLFENADQLVRGDLVTVGGQPVGNVTNIVLTPNYQAEITIHVNAPLAPLHAGTSAQIRVPSLSGVANRYIALSPGPNNAPALSSGATLPTSATHGVTDIDQLFDVFNARTRRALKEVLQGSAEEYSAPPKYLQATAEYFAPSLAASDHFFAELSSDQTALRELVVQGAKATTTIAARRTELADLVEHGDQAFQALGAEQENLAKAVEETPPTLRAGNTTFLALPPALSAVHQLIDAAKPSTAQLALLFERLRPFFAEAVPVVQNLSQAVSKPGPNNDLTDAFQAVPAIAHTLETGNASSIKGLEESTAFFAKWRAYAPELVGFARTLGQSTGYYDANGHYVRAAPTVASFTLGPEGSLVPAENIKQGLQNLKTGQLQRCPGTATQPAPDGSSPFTDGGQLECNPAEVP
jgi:phospholipid/cholesterol/gamma-HCH transport system substrate-binding protein